MVSAVHAMEKTFNRKALYDHVENRVNEIKQECVKDILIIS